MDFVLIVCTGTGVLARGESVVLGIHRLPQLPINIARAKVRIQLSLLHQDVIGRVDVGADAVSRLAGVGVLAGLAGGDGGDGDFGLDFHVFVLILIIPIPRLVPMYPLFLNRICRRCRIINIRRRVEDTGPGCRRTEPLHGRFEAVLHVIMVLLGDLLLLVLVHAWARILVEFLRWGRHVIRTLDDAVEGRRTTHIYVNSEPLTFHGTASRLSSGRRCPDPTTEGWG